MSLDNAQPINLLYIQNLTHKSSMEFGPEGGGSVTVSLSHWDPVPLLDSAQSLFIFLSKSLCHNT
jgi:hypothetical protein